MDEDDIFENGTPWDYVVDLGRLVDKLVEAHNQLAEDHERLVQRTALLEARLDELRRKHIG